MRVNTKIRYGLRTMIEIANSSDGDGILQKDIAVNQNISLKYLDSIIMSLKLKGLIANNKGKGSGYRLTHPADQITLLEIYTAFEPVTFVDCIDNNGFCNKANACNARDCWRDVKFEFEAILANKKLSQFL